MLNQGVALILNDGPHLDRVAETNREVAWMRDPRCHSFEKYALWLVSLLEQVSLRPFNVLSLTRPDFLVCPF